MFSEKGFKNTVSFEHVHVLSKSRLLVRGNAPIHGYFNFYQTNEEALIPKLDKRQESIFKLARRKLRYKCWSVMSDSVSHVCSPCFVSTLNFQIQSSR